MPQTPLHSHTGRLLAHTAAVAAAGFWWAGLTGCAPMLPPASPVTTTLPPSYTTWAGGTTNRAEAAITDWQHHFTDPDLLALLTLALAHNRDLKTAVLRVQEARAAYGIQQADRLPTVAASLAATRAGVPGDLNITGRPVVGNQFQLGVGFSSWEIDFWGRVSHLNDAALQSYLATQAAQQAVTVGLIAQVANSYLVMRELDERLTLAQRTLASRAESLRIFQRRVALGATSRLELTQVELLWQQAATLVAQLEQARATQRHALQLLVGAAVAEPMTTQGLDSLNLSRELAPGLPSELLVRRPDLVAAEHELQAARANVEAARAAFFPRIALTSSAGTASAALDGLFQGGSQAWTFAPLLTLPMLDGGRRQAALDLSSVRREQAVVRYEQAIQAAFRDVSDALAARHWLAQQVNTQRATLALQNERSRLAKLRYDNGAIRYLEVLDAERDRLAAEQALVQTRRAELAAQVALYAALGGGLPPQAPDPSPDPSTPHRTTP